MDMKGKMMGSVVLALLVGVVIGVGGLWAWNSTMSKSGAAPVSQVDQAQVKDLIAKVGKLVILPTGEEPVIATINDAAGLAKEQPFYKGSANGDVVLVYQKAAKAIVYSVTRNIIVNVGPVVLQDQTAPAKTTATSTKK